MHKKVVFSVCVLALTALSFTLVWQYEQQHAVYAYNPDNLIRLHVVANSDSEVDQALKRRVRDTVVRGMTPEIAGVENIADARSIVRADLGEIGKMAAAELRKQGFDYPVRVCYGQFPFPTKSYGSLTLPAGEYEAVKIILGEGAGANWWCVLFPPLCFLNMEDKSGQRLNSTVSPDNRSKLTVPAAPTGVPAGMSPAAPAGVPAGMSPAAPTGVPAEMSPAVPAGMSPAAPNMQAAPNDAITTSASTNIEFRLKIVDILQMLGEKFSSKEES